MGPGSAQGFFLKGDFFPRSIAFSLSGAVFVGLLYHMPENQRDSALFFS